VCIFGSQSRGPVTAKSGFHHQVVTVCRNSAFTTKCLWAACEAHINQQVLPSTTLTSFFLLCTWTVFSVGWALYVTYYLDERYFWNGQLEHWKLRRVTWEGCGSHYSRLSQRRMYAFRYREREKPPSIAVLHHKAEHNTVNMFTLSRCVELFARGVGEKTGVEPTPPHCPYSAGDNCQPSVFPPRNYENEPTTRGMEKFRCVS
jgi:hypothetical protein